MSGRSNLAPAERDPEEYVKAGPADTPNEHEQRETQPAANDNSTNSPNVVLRATGNGALLYRALARVLVRRELSCAREMRVHDDREPSDSAQ